MEPDELLGVAVIAMIRQIETFDLERGFTFSTHAYPRIRGAIFDEARNRSWMRKQARGKINKVDQARVQFNGNATPDELSEYTKVPLRECTEVRLGLLSTVVYIDEMGLPVRLAELIKDKPIPSKVMERATFQQITKGFNKIEKLILYLYYYENLRFWQIAQHVGLTESRVCQIHQDLMERLRAKKAELLEEAC